MPGRRLSVDGVADDAWCTHALCWLGPHSSPRAAAGSAWVRIGVPAVAATPTQDCTGEGLVWNGHRPARSATWLSGVARPARTSQPGPTSPPADVWPE